MLNFLNVDGEIIDSIETVYDNTSLNVSVDMSSLTSGVCDLLHNGVKIGHYKKISGRGEFFEIIDGGNLNRLIKDEDTFTLKIVQASPTSYIGREKKINVDRSIVDKDRIPQLSEIYQKLGSLELSHLNTKEDTESARRSLAAAISTYTDDYNLCSFVKMAEAYRDLDRPQKQVNWIRDDCFCISQGGTLSISVAQILFTDRIRDIDGVFKRSEKLEVEDVFDIYGGTVEKNYFNSKLSSINFKPNVTQYKPAGFNVRIRNTKSGREFVSKVTIIVTPPIPIQIVGDVFNVTQWNSVDISIADLLSNDIPKGLYFGEYFDVRGGTLVRSGDALTFKSTDLVGEPAGFSYSARNSSGVYASGSVKVNVLELPMATAYVGTMSEIEALKKTYVPPTMLSVFNTWPRFSYNYYYPTSAPSSSEASAWRYDSSSKSFWSTKNTTNMIGLVSKEEYDNYHHKARLRSTAYDDDFNGLIIAFKRINGYNHALIAYRQAGGLGYGSNNNFGIAYMYSSTVSLIKTTSVLNSARDEWYGKYTWVDVERVGDVIRAKASSFNSNYINPNSLIEIDLNDYSNLRWAKGACSYGYANQSQDDSTFESVTFDGGEDKSSLYDFENNTVWIYSGGSWSKKSGATIQSELGYPRTVRNPNTGQTFRILKDTIVKL
jgi:hypothetical protein